MSDEDLKRPASTPNTNPRPTKRMHLEDIFGGDEHKHNAADAVLSQSYVDRVICDHFATNCRSLSNSELVDGVKSVISKVSTM